PGQFSLGVHIEASWFTCTDGRSPPIKLLTGERTMHQSGWARVRPIRSTAALWMVAVMLAISGAAPHAGKGCIEYHWRAGTTTPERSGAVAQEGLARVKQPAVAGDTRDGKRLVRVAAAQPENRTIDFRLNAAEVLNRVDRSLGELEQLIRKAGLAGCDAVALPEDTLGLLKWE